MAPRQSTASSYYENLRELSSDQPAVFSTFPYPCGTPNVLSRHIRKNSNNRSSQHNRSHAPSTRYGASFWGWLKSGSLQVSGNQVLSFVHIPFSSSSRQIQERDSTSHQIHFIRSLTLSLRPCASVTQLQISSQIPHINHLPLCMCSIPNYDKTKIKISPYNIP